MRKMEGCMCKIIFVQNSKMANFLKDMIKMVAENEYREIK